MPTRNLTHLLNEVRISKVDGHLNVLNGGWVLEYFQMDLPRAPYALPTYRIFTGQLLTIAPVLFKSSTGQGARRSLLVITGALV